MKALVALSVLSAGCSLVPQTEAARPVTALAASDTVSLPDVAERVVQGVVSVNTERAISEQGFGFSRRAPMQEFTVRGMGSGVIIDADGVIVTNHHVIDGASKVMVTLSDGESYEAEVVGSDPRSDVAVLRMLEPPKGLQPVEWGDSSGVRLGETVLAVGNPYGIGHTLTRGIVSAKGRARVGVAEYEDFIQTDAAINPGNSGGALVDLNGRLIGIPTAIFSKTGGFSGISFAIPSHMAQAVADDILEDGQVDRGWLGVVLSRTGDGVQLEDIGEGTAAEAAGLLAGDVVVRFNGEDIRSLESFRGQVAFAGAGTPFQATVLRDGKPRSIKGVLGRRPDDPVR